MYLLWIQVELHLIDVMQITFLWFARCRLESSGFTLVYFAIINRRSADAAATGILLRTAHLIVEKRNAFRVDTRLRFTWEPESASTEGSDHIEAIMREAAIVDEWLAKLVDSVNISSPEIRQGLELLSKHVSWCREEARPRNARWAVETINLSGTGMSFRWHLAPNTGDTINISLVLPVRHELIKLKAQVVACEHGVDNDADDQRPLVRVRFLPRQAFATDPIYHYVNQVQISNLNNDRLREVALNSL